MHSEIKDQLAMMTSRMPPMTESGQISDYGGEDIVETHQHERQSRTPRPEAHEGR